MKNYLDKTFTKPTLSILIMILIISCVIFVYWQVKSHDFINFDDPDYVITNNFVHKGISIESIQWAFHIPQKGDKSYWHPLTWLSHMLDYQFFGLDAGMYHLMNLLYHIINVILLYLVFFKMTGAVWRSAFVAALFGLHPMNVDSVAWIAERKNLLSTTFWLLTILLYIYYIRRPTIFKYLIVILTFVLGLLAKPMIVTLPFVLLLLDYWPLNRINENHLRNINNIENKHNLRLFNIILEKIPMIILSIICIYISSMSLRNTGIDIKAIEVPMGLRIENAIVSYLHYIWKMFFPIDLTFFYPFPNSISMIRVVGSLLVLICISLLTILTLKKYPYFIVGWLWFVGTLVPVSGIIQGGLWPAMAERWAYVPFIGLFIIIAWGIPDIIRKLYDHRITYTIIYTSGILVLIFCIIISLRQVAYWENDLSLFSHAINVNPENDVAYVNLGKAYENKGKNEIAIHHYEEALKIHRNNYVAMNCLGDLYYKLGMQDKSIYFYKESIRYNPYYASAHMGLGTVYVTRGEIDNAIKQFLYTISIDPANTLAFYNLGILYIKKGELNKAKEYILYALKLDPNDADTHYTLGVLLMNQSRLNDAIDQFNETIKINPKHNDAPRSKMFALNYKKKIDDDIIELEKIIKTEPDNPKILQKLAIMYSLIREDTRALDCLQRLVQIQPDNPDGYYNLACIYAREGNINNAIKWLKISIEKGFNNWKLLQKDNDLENLRNTQIYKDLINKGRG